MKRIKLVYICPWLSTEFRGPLYGLLDELSKYIDVICICARQKYIQYFTRSEKYKKEIEKMNEHFKIHRFNLRTLPHDIILPTNLKKILDIEKPDIVQSDEFFRFTSIQAAEWCKKNNIPFILNSRMRYRPGFVRNFAIWIFKLLAKKAVKQAKYVIATQGKCSKDEFLKWFPKKKNIIIITTGINIKEFIKDKSKFDFRKKYKISNKKIILDVTRIYPVKRIDLLIRAFSIVKKHYDCVLVIVGPADNKEKRKIYALTKKLSLKIDKDIIFMGSIKNKDLAPVYAAASIFVNTSETEGLCFSFFEAMSFKLPIIAFNVGGNSGAIKQGKNGFLLKFGNVNGLTNKMLFLLKNENLRKKLGNYGFKRVQKEFDIEIISKKLINIYKSLLS